MEILDTFFQDLTFDEVSHRYFVNGKPLRISVSGILDFFGNKFDAPTVARFVAKSRKITTEEVLSEWKKTNVESLRVGTKTHLFGEKYPYDNTLVPESGYEEAIKKFWDELPSHIELLKCEYRMYHKEKFFAGTADLLLRNKETGNIIIGDYKTNKDLFKNASKKKLRGRFSDLVDNPFNKYQIQLNYYQQMLEQIPGIKVSSRKIIWVKPTGEYEIFNCEDFQERLHLKRKRKKLKIK